MCKRFLNLWPVDPNWATPRPYKLYMYTLGGTMDFEFRIGIWGIYVAGVYLDSMDEWPISW